MSVEAIDIIYIILCAIVGIAIVFQAAMNATLGSLSGLNSWGALMSFVIGLPPILIYYIVESKGFTTGSYNQPIWTYLGGILGALYIFTVIITTQRLGTATVLGTIVASQVITSILVDHFAIAGMQQRDATIGRICGAILVAIGAVLIALF